MIMKKTLLLSLAALVVALAAKADNYGGTNGCGGGSSQEFEQVIVLSGTANVSTNAVGVADLRTDDDDATNTAEVKVGVAGLDAGTYTVSVTDITGTNSYTLGTLDVSSNSYDCGQRGENDELFTGDGTNAPVIATNVVTFGRGEFDLPAGLDPTNVAFLFVFDTNGVVDFTGDFTSLTNISAVYYSETVPVVPGTAPQAQGQGKLSLAYKQGKLTSSFALNASGLTPKQSLILNANGVKSTTTSASTKGAVSVKTLPHTSLPDLKTVEAKDKKGNLVFSVQF